MAAPQPTVSVVTDKLSGTKLADSHVAFAPKTAPGSRGTATEVKTNLTKMLLKPNTPYYKYDIRMYALFESKTGIKEKELSKQTRDDFPEQERKNATVAIYQKLVPENQKFFGDKNFYDRAAILFSMKKFDLKGEEKVFDLPKDYILNITDACGFKVVVKQCTEGFQTSTNDLQKVVNVRQAEQDRTLLEALNIICSQTPYFDTEQFVSYGTGTHYCIDPFKNGFKQSDFAALPDSKYMGGGASKSVKVLEGTEKGKSSAYVVCEMKKTVFHADNTPLLDKIKSFSFMRGAPFNVQTANGNQKAIRDQLKGLHAICNYGSKRTIKIDAIGAPASQVNVQTKTGVVSTESYFVQKYNIKLKYPGLFTVISRGPKGDSFYPVELLLVAPSQRVIDSQQTPDQNAITIKACAALPADRLRQTEKMKDALKLKKDEPLLIGAGVQLETQMATVPARVLPSCTIQYAANKIVHAPDNCKWSSEGQKFILPTAIPKWMFIGLFTPNDSNRFPFESYMKKLMEMMKNKGMTFQPPMTKTFDRVDKSTVDTVFAKAQELAIQFIFFVSSDAVKQHDYIKSKEVMCQILTQEVRVSKAISVLERNQVQTLENIVMKTNQKLGGMNNYVLLNGDPKVRDLILAPHRLIVGFEISNPAPLSKTELERGFTYKMPSVLGWGGNYSKNPLYFLGDYRYVQPRQSDMMGSELRSIAKYILTEFKNARGKPATDLVFYFNGVSEGQWNLIASDYLTCIRNAISDLSPNYKPKIVAIAVSKEHTERLYKKQITGTSAAQQNIQPGSVVDTVIVNPTINEFYLNSHSAFQGTAKTPKYSVIVNELAMSNDAIQSMTHGLTYCHNIVNMTVSLPAALVVADRCSKRGHNVYNATHINSSGDVGVDIEGANQNLTNQGKKLSKFRYNA